MRIPECCTLEEEEVEEEEEEEEEEEGGGGGDNYSMATHSTESTYIMSLSALLEL